MCTPVALRIAALVALFAVTFGAAAEAQVAPTLPSDTLDGRTLPYEAARPRYPIAPTLPSDTLGADRQPDNPNIVPSAPLLPPRDPVAKCRIITGDPDATGDCLAPDPLGADSLPADSLPADSLPADSLPADSLPA